MIFSKALAAKLKSVLPSLIASQQNVYVQNRYIAGRRKVNFWYLDISDKLNIDGYLVTVDIEKAFDSLDHGFLLVVLKKLALVIFCVISGMSTTPCFILEKGVQQGDPICAYLFIIALEIIFATIKGQFKKILTSSIILIYYLLIYCVRRWHDISFKWTKINQWTNENFWVIIKTFWFKT